MSGPSRCPLCGSEITGASCGVCRADLGGATALELGEVDEQLDQLTARRFHLLTQLSEEARASSPGPAALPGWSQHPTLPPPPPPPGGTGLPAFMAPYPTEAGHPGGAPAITGGPGPEVSSILLTLGTALLVIAALVFAAVTWSRVGALGQGALLVGLTLASGFGTDRAAKRGLTGTAEALGVLTVLMGPLVAQALRITAGLVAVDDRTWANWGSWTWWPAVILLVGAAALAFGRAVTVRSPQWLGAVLVQLALPLWTALAPLPTWAKVAIVAAQAGVVGSVVARDRQTSVTGRLWWAGAIGAWFWAAVATMTLAVDHDLTGSVQWPLVGGLVALAVASAVVSWTWRDTSPRGGASAVAALGAGLLAVVVVVVGTVVAAVAWPAIAVVGAVAAVATVRFGGHRRFVLTPVCWVLVAAAAQPAIVGLVAALNAAGAASDPVWGSSFGALPVVGGSKDVVSGLAVAHNPTSVFVIVMALAVTWATAPRWRRTTHLPSTVAGTAVILLLALPPLAGVPLGWTTLLLLAAASLMVATMVWPDRVEVSRPVGLVGASVLLVIGGLWALGTQPLTMVAVAVGLVLAVALVAVALRSDDELLAGPATTVAATALVVEVGLVAYSAGITRPWAVTASALVAAVAAVGLPVGETSDERIPARSMVFMAAAMMSALLHVGAVFVLTNGAGNDTTPVGPLTVALAVGATAWAVVAARRPARASIVGWVALAGVEAVVLVWFRLSEASVVVVEAYSVPLALLVAGVLIMAAKVGPGLRESRSWSLEGPALALALWPTAFIALGDPGVTRQLVGLGVGAVALAAGAVWRRRAPVDVGGAAVAVIGLQALLPYVAEVPRWISLGLVGIALVGLGATFERRRQNFDEARRHYAALR